MKIEKIIPHCETWNKKYLPVTLIFEFFVLRINRYKTNWPYFLVLCIQALEERLAKRRQIIAMRKLQDQQESEVVVQNVESHEDVLKHLVQDGKLTEKKKNQLLNEYLQDLNRLTKARDIGKNWLTKARDKSKKASPRPGI